MVLFVLNYFCVGKMNPIFVYILFLVMVKKLGWDGYEMFWHFNSMPSNQRLLLLVMRCSDISTACPPTKDYCYWLCDVLTFQQHALQPKIIVTDYVMFWHFSSMPSNQRLLLLVMRCSDISAACPLTKDYCYWNRNVFDSHYYYIFAESGSCCHDHIRMVVGFITTHAISAYHH